MDRRLKGIYAATWSPVDSKSQFDLPSFEKHLQFLRTSKIHGLMLMGSTGEFVRFDLDQRKSITEAILKRAGELSTIVNVSHGGYLQALDLARHAKALGASAISALPPLYFKTSQPDLAEYFVRLAEQSAMPLVLYNYPELSGLKIELETLQAVCRRVPIAGFKQSGSDFDYHQPLGTLAREYNFSLLSGFDTRLDEAMKLGACGAISGLANAVPELLLEIFHNAEHDPQTANGAADRLKGLCQLIAPLDFPLNIAALVQARGFVTGPYKQPLSQHTQEAFTRVVHSVRAWLTAEGLNSL